MYPNEESAGQTRDLEETVWECPSAEGKADQSTETHELRAIPTWILEVRSGPEAGRRIEVPAGRVSLGRSVRCAIRLKDPSVSRVHLWVESGTEGIILQEESTKNGTSLDGDPFLEGVAKEGQRIGVGQTILEVRKGQDAQAGLVEQAMRFLGAPALPARTTSPLPQGAPKRRSSLVVLGMAVGGLAFAALWSKGEPVANEGEDIGGVQEARLLFDQGLERVKEGEEEEARAFFVRAANWDPQSEEPARYLRWLDAGGARDEKGSASLELGTSLAGDPEFILPGASEEAQDREDEAVKVHPAEEGGGEGRVLSPPKRRRPPRGDEFRAQAERDALADEVQALLDRAEAQVGIAAVASLRAAWEKAGKLEGGEDLRKRAAQRLAKASFELGEDALAIGRLRQAVAHFQLALLAQPGHGPARERLASLEARAESFLVEGYALLDRDPERAKEMLALVLALTKAEDPLHRRAEKWLRSARVPSKSPEAWSSEVGGAR